MTDIVALLVVREDTQPLYSDYQLQSKQKLYNFQKENGRV